MVPIIVGSYTYSDFSGTYETFTASEDGTYFIQLWGARGGNTSSYSGGRGGYSAGNIVLESGDKLYVYLGGRGGSNNTATNVGGYNGGGYSGYNPSTDNYNGGGGGSTDIRLVKGTWNNFNSLKSRIMVAAGGGGGGWYGGYNGENTIYVGPGSGGSGFIGNVNNGKTIAGNLQIPTHDGTSTMVGNSGNGYAKITLVDIR